MKRAERDIRVRVRRGLHGLGLVSVTPFRRGERVIEYMGEIIDDDEADRRNNRYIFEVSKDVNIDGATRKNLARYVNHSCMPNCSIEYVGKRVYYEAKHRIEAGEELTVNYGRDYFDHFIGASKCRCGAKRHLGQKRRKRKT